MKKKLFGIFLLISTAFSATVYAKPDLEKNRKQQKYFKHIKNWRNSYQKHRHQQLDKALSDLIREQSLTGSPLKNRVVPSVSDPVVQLGKELFFSKTLSGDRDSACVACHHPMLGGGDNLSLPVGVEADDPNLLGLGRTNYGAEHAHEEGGPPVPRNAPTTFNVIAWDQVMFHDGRVESLDKIPSANGKGDRGIRTPDSESINVADPLAGTNLVQAQARFPVTSPEEMKGFNHGLYFNQGIRELIASRLVSDDDSSDWLKKFSYAFDSSDNETENEIITEQRVFFAIGEYERSQAFVNTPWKKYVEGDKRALSMEAKKGALLFFTSREKGGADCSRCHSGDFFTDEGFHNLAMPQIGPGKGDGEYGSKDFGRARETGNELDKFAFRTPSLINVEVTGPWSHAGAYTSLEAVVKHHLNVGNAIVSYDENQLFQENISNRDRMYEHTEEAFKSVSFDLENINLNSKRVSYLVEFLKSLTDPCTKDFDCLSPWIVSPDPFYFKN